MWLFYYQTRTAAADPEISKKREDGQLRGKRRERGSEGTFNRGPPSLEK